MPPRQKPPPRRWLMTDERLGQSLEEIVARLPRGTGIVFRHHRTPRRERRALFDRLRRVARARGLMLVLAGTVREAIGWRADGIHGPAAHRRAIRLLVRTMAVHDAREAWAARAADLIFVSPVFATRSHPGAKGLGRRGFAALGRHHRTIALGGMDEARFRTLRPSGAYGWAAIDAWMVEGRIAREGTETRRG